MRKKEKKGSGELGRRSRKRETTVPVMEASSSKIRREKYFRARIYERRGRIFISASPL